MYKKLLFLIPVFLFLLALPFVVADIEDDFVRVDSGTLGTATNGNVWSENEVTGAFGISSNNFSFVATGSGDNYAILQFNNSNPDRVDYIINIEDTSEVSYIDLRSDGGAAAGSRRIYMSYVIDAQIKYYDGGWNALDTPTTLVDDTDYLISIRDIDYTAYTFDLYIDDVLKTTDAGFINDGSISHARLMVGGDTDFVASCLTTGGDDCVVPPPGAINDSTESTAVIKQVGSVTFTGGTASIVSGIFNISVNNTPLYGTYGFDILSTADNTIFCESLIDGVVVGNVTRTNVAGELGNGFVQFPVMVLDNSSHTRELRCNRPLGGGSITVSNTVGIGHIFINEDGEFLNYNTSTVNTDVVSGSGFTLLDSLDIFIPDKNETDNTSGRVNHIVVESSLVYTNNNASSEILSVYASINGSNCTFMPRTVNAGDSGSVSYDCFLSNVTRNSTYTVDFYGNGSTANYQGEFVVKTFFLSLDEIIGGTGILTGFVYSGDTDVLIINVTGGNINHDLSNVFTKLSYSLFTDKDTTTTFRIEVVNGTNYTTINWSRFLGAGDIGVLIGQDSLENLPKDSYDVLLYGNCGAVGANCTIEGGQSGGYITDVVPAFNRGFNVTAFNFYTNVSILDFNVTDSFGTTITTNVGLITINTNLTTEDYVVRADSNGTNYFGRTILSHDTSTNLNVSMYPGVVTIDSPANDTFVNSMPTFSFSYINGVWKGLTCNYYDNRTGSFVSYSNRTNVGSGVVTTFLSIPVFPSSANYSFYYTCENDEYQSFTYNVVYDVTDPVITFVTPSSLNNSFFNGNFTLNISIVDVNNYDALINITNPGGVTLFYSTYNTSGVITFNISNRINLSDPGKHTLFIEAADGHTSERIEVFKTLYIPDGVRFNKELNIYGYNNDYKVTPIKLEDRYSLLFEPEDESWFESQYEALAGHVTAPKDFGDPDVFIVEVDEGSIEIVQDSDYIGHMIVKKGSDYKDWYWVDFENEQDAPVYLWQYDSKTVEVYVYGDGNYTFNSVGRLNVINQTIEFYFDTSDISLVATYEPNVVTGFTTVYDLAATLNPARYNLSSNKTVTIDIDGTLYDAVSNGSSINTFFYYYPFSIPFDYSSSTLTHQWYFETIDLTNATVQTTTGPLVQNVFIVEIGTCNASQPYELLNFSYFDEKTGVNISADMNYQLNFFDGTYTYTNSGFFTDSFSNSICTNLNPANVTYNFDVNGLVTLSNVDDNYTTRVFTFSPAAPISTSNADPQKTNLYLVKLADSQSVEYTWLSTSYELLDGVMRIYRCYTNGSNEMVESALITGGRSTANIELLTSSYSYDVVVNGNVYSDDSYNVCHIESSQSITYYVELTKEQLTPVSGLLFTGCDLEGPDNNSVVTMTWADNSYDDEEITACLQGLRESLGNYVEVFEQCSVIDTGTLQVIVPDNNNEYLVRGFLTQGNSSSYCNDLIKVGDEDNAGDVLGMTGLFAIILFVLALALYYSDSGENSVLASAIAILICWVVGWFAFGWVATSAIVTYLLIIVFISRGSRKR